MSQAIPIAVCMAKATEACAISGGQTSPLTHGSVAVRPEIDPKRLESSLHAARAEEWLAKTPPRAAFCDACTRRYATHHIVIMADRRLRLPTRYGLFFAAFGHPYLVGKEDWRRTVRRPMAIGHRTEGPPPKLGPRGLKRWLNRARKFRRRMRRKAQRYLGVIGAGALQWTWPVW